MLIGKTAQEVARRYGSGRGRLHKVTLTHQLTSAYAFLTRKEAERYLVFVGVAFIAWGLWRRVGRRRPRLQPASIARKQLVREMLLSASSLLIFGLISLIILALAGPSHPLFYTPLDSFGWPYLIASFFLMLMIQDTYFYWTHRLMHHPRLFRLIHRAHHLSTNPDPLSTYSIHPIEAVINPGATVLILVLLPKHLLIFVLFTWFNTAYAVYGHLGYEILPRSVARHWLGRWINTSIAHNTHHARVRYNFSWYFLFWDRLMGTLDPSYEKRYASGTASPATMPGRPV
jgi:Delta7-sterol 5-desaturase